jgi:ribosomal protein S14
MSKQSEAKARQGYVPKTVRMCQHCKHFKSDFIREPYLGRVWIRETNLRCGVGGFKVKKTGACDQWEGLT